MAARAGDTGLSKVRRYWPGRAPDWAWAGAAVAHDEDDARLVSTLDEIKHVEEEALRARIRERALLLRQHEEEQLLLHHHHQRHQEDEAASESDETAAESDSDDEQMAVVYMAAPLFVPKSQRDTIRLREEEQHRQRRRLELELDKKRLEDRKMTIKKQMRFMRRYYHKGCFFQDDADGAAQTAAGACEIYRRDFSGPTGLDKMDVSVLPKVMQVKHFGRRGGRKWTHLVNEDTTYRNYS
nr:microfibrillar-associated protein 1 [Oryza sativa Japonica Group]